MKAVKQRVDFAVQILTTIVNDGFDVTCIWITDEEHFHFNRIVNKRNWRFRGYENSHLCEEKTLHPSKVSAWPAVCAIFVLSAFFSYEKR